MIFITTKQLSQEPRLDAFPSLRVCETSGTQGLSCQGNKK